MECREAEQLIDRYLDRELSPELAGQLEFHLADCPRCRVKYGSVVDMLSSPQPLAVPGGLRERVLDTVNQQGMIQRATAGVVGERSPRRRWLGRIGATAAAAGLFLAGWFSVQFWSSSTQLAVEPQPVVVVVSPWLISSTLQSAMKPGPASPIASVIQAAMMEQLTAEMLKAPPAVTMRRRPIVIEVPHHEIPPQVLEVPMLAPVYRL